MSKKSKKAATKSEPEVVATPTVPAETEVEQQTTAKAGKIINNEVAVDLSVFLRSLYYTANDVTTSPDKLVIIRVIIQFETNVKGVPFGGVYDRFEIRKDGSVLIWSNAAADPAYIINNAVRWSDGKA